MAKNISKNQWFKDIADDLYLNTAVLNDILFITVRHAKGYRIDRGTKIATIRNSELFEKSRQNHLTNYTGELIRIVNDELVASGDINLNTTGFTFVTLKSKQLETDFYSPEQLAEMHNDDPVEDVG